MKKTIMLLTLITALTVNGVAVNVLDIATTPTKPTFNDSVDVRTYIDGENSGVNSVTVDIRENNELIAENVEMSYVAGREQDISSWAVQDAFTVESSDVNNLEYDLNVQAIDTTGEQDTGVLTVDVNSNSTIIEEPQPDQSRFFGLTIPDIIAVIFVVVFGWIILYD